MRFGMKRGKKWDPSKDQLWSTYYQVFEVRCASLLEFFFFFFVLNSKTDPGEFSACASFSYSAHFIQTGLIKHSVFICKGRRRGKEISRCVSKPRSAGGEDLHSLQQVESLKFQPKSSRICSSSLGSKVFTRSRGLGNRCSAYHCCGFKKNLKF